MIKINEYEIQAVLYSYKAMLNAMQIRNIFDDIEPLKDLIYKQSVVDLENFASESFRIIIHAFCIKYHLDKELIEDLLNKHSYYEPEFMIEFACDCDVLILEN